MMDKLTRQQEDIICKLLHCSYNEEITQFILNTIGENNWSRRVLSDCMYSFLTDEQRDLSEPLGGGYSVDEVAKSCVETIINCRIAVLLEKQGVTKYLYENEDYLDEIRNGTIICGGINVEEIKRTIQKD